MKIAELLTVIGAREHADDVIEAASAKLDEALVILKSETVSEQA